MTRYADRNFPVRGPVVCCGQLHGNIEISIAAILKSQAQTRWTGELSECIG